MALTSGTHLGVYEIVEPLGAGGMGEVYRARDPRLRRDVAIKVLPDSASGDRMARLDREARVIGALNHPHIVTVFDVGVHDDRPYIVMERLEGDTVRAGIGTLSVKRALQLAAQAARGLAAAHDKGIVHRDIKPDNLFITHDGHLKVLDFGLADWQPGSSAAAGQTTGVSTATGTVLGTAGYMAPEQVRGEDCDARSDIFSLGVTLYEMLSGRHPFARPSAVETLAAILHEDPAPLDAAKGVLPPAAGALVARCLEKRPADRFQSAADLGFALQAVSDPGTGREHAVEAPPPRRPWAMPMAAALAVGAIGVALWASWPRPTDVVPTFEQLTFRRGAVDAARFAPDGSTVLYSGAFEQDPAAVYSVRVGRPESRALDVPGVLQSISSSGEVAVTLGSAVLSGPTRVPGTVARVPIEGGSPRELSQGVAWADWTADGKELAVIRQLDNTRMQLEWPSGHAVAANIGGVLSHPRVAPSGERLAFFEFVGYTNIGALVLVSREGARQTLASGLIWPSGLSWDPTSSTLWFATSDGHGATAIHAMAVNGRDRIVDRIPGYVIVHDRAADGRLLVTHDEWRVELMARPVGSADEREISWLDVSNVADISSDGSHVLLNALGAAAGAGVVSYLREVTGRPAVRLADGYVPALSPDGSAAVVVRAGTDAPLAIVPTRAGDVRPIAAALPSNIGAVSWMPDGRALVVSAGQADRPWRCYLVTLSGGEPRPLTPDDTRCAAGAVSPDATWVIATSGRGETSAYPIAGGPPRPVPALEPGERPQGWSTDGRALHVFRPGLPATLTRLDLEGGGRRTIATLAPHDRLGVYQISRAAITPDAAAYAYSYLRHTSTLFVASGLH